MPIDAHLLKEATKPLDQRILDFLQHHRGQAFTVFEVGAGVEQIDVTTFTLQVALESMAAANNRSPTLGRYQDGLSRLLTSGTAVTGEVRGQQYYTAAS